MIRIALLLLFGLKAFSATNYYVAPSYGSSSPAGSAPGTSITNAFKYLSTVLNTYAGVGDTIYISPESPVFECINLTKSFPTGPVYIFGDVKNTAGFTNSSGNKVSAGAVIWSNKTNGWTSAGAADHTFDMNGFSNVAMTAVFVHNQGGGRAIIANSSSRKLYVTNCTFASSSAYAVDFNMGNTGDGFYVYADNCNFICLHTTLNGFSLAWNGVGATDWDMNIQTRNCVFFSTGSYAAGGFKGGGTAGVPGGWKSYGDIYFSDEGFVAGESSTNTFPYIFDTSYVFGTSTIYSTGQMRSFRTAWNGPAIANINLSDSAMRTYTNNVVGSLLNFGHGRKVGLGFGSWFSPIPINPLNGWGATNLLTLDNFSTLRKSTNTIGAFEPSKSSGSAF